MNNFPDMTEEQIKWMIAHCVRVMSESSPGDFEYLTAQIALAALTAETDYVRYSCGCCGYESLSYKHICPKCNHHTLHADKLYTAPPAPVLCSPAYHDEAKRLAELHGMSFVVFRHGEAPAVADPTRVIIGFTDKGLGHDTTGGQQ